MKFNRERGEWPLVSGGKTYKLRLTTNAMAELEEFAKGETWDSIVLGLARGSVAACRLFLWAALQDSHGDVATADKDGLKRVGDIVDDAGGFEAITAQVRAFVQSNAKPEDEKKPGAPAANPPEAGATPAGGGTGATRTPASSPSA